MRGVRGGVSWLDLLAVWPFVEADLHSEYGIADLDDPEHQHRTWPWLRDRIIGLLAKPTSRTYHTTRKPDPARTREGAS